MVSYEGYISLLKSLPSVVEPVKRLTFKERLKWTGAILLLYFLMSQIPVYGIEKQTYEYFKFLEIILGSRFGSLMTLGIGPIVTSSIILQLLVGSKIIPWDLSSDEGRTLFQGTQKLMTVIVSFVEATAYVSFGAIKVMAPDLFLPVVLQLAFGGILVLFMDEVVSKWGIGSGVSLFIVAGVSKTIVVRSINPLTQGGTLPGPGNPSAGLIPFAITAVSAGEPVQAFISLLPLLSTIVVFFLVVYMQAIRVEIPLAFSMVSGFGRRWPLKFLYTSNIPVILIAALIANIRVMAKMAYDKGATFLGTFDASGNVNGGLLYFLTPPSNEAIAGLATFMGMFALIGAMYFFLTRGRGSLKIIAGFSILGALTWVAISYSLNLASLSEVTSVDVIRIFTYMGFMMLGSMVFSIFWVNTSGMDAESVAKQISSIGMGIPGYRRDIRIIKRVLERYISSLAILGGLAVGFLAAYADLTNALGTGTGILLAVMIVYQLYEQIAMQNLEDMHPAIRRFFGK